MFYFFIYILSKRPKQKFQHHLLQGPRIWLYFTFFSLIWILCIVSQRKQSFKNPEADKWPCEFSLSTPSLSCFPLSCLTLSSSPSVWPLFFRAQMALVEKCIFHNFAIFPVTIQTFSLRGEISAVASKVWIKETFMVVMTVKVKFRLPESLKQRRDWSPHHLHLIWVVSKLFWK